ncbi:MAG: hypothetical protein ACI4JT_08740 [Oscillospiraceae bacterium]
MNVDFNNPENAAIPHPEKVYLGSGTLHLACSKKKTVITVVITAFIFGFFAGYLVKLARLIFRGNETAADFFVILLMIMLLVCGTILSVLRGGEKYQWHATGREFTVSRKNRGATIIFYKEVVTIDYEPLKFLHFFPHGYTVFVRTVRDEYEFKYVFPGAKTSQPFEDTPFGKLSKIVDDLRAQGLDKALREKENPFYDPPSIEDAFRNIIAEQKAREFEKENRNNYIFPD